MDGDPTADISATRNIVAVWKGGVRLDREAVAAAVAAQPAAPLAAGARVAPPLGIVSTFDNGTTATTYGMGWTITTDKLVGGTSTAEMSVMDGGAQGTPKALDVRGEVLGGLAYAWAGTMFFRSAVPMAPADLSSAKEIRFWAKGDGRSYSVMVFAESRGQMPLIRRFMAGSEWKEFVFPIASFDGIDGHDIAGIAITAGPEPGAFHLRLDELRVQ